VAIVATDRGGNSVGIIGVLGISIAAGNNYAKKELKPVAIAKPGK
jgi:hypothetical protein